MITKKAMFEDILINSISIKNKLILPNLVLMLLIYTYGLNEH